MTLVGLVALLLLAACGDDDDANGTSVAPILGVGPGISVAEALDSELDGPLLVNGFLLIRDDDVRLCEVLAESFPPQCGGAYLVVDGLDLPAFTLSEASGVRWTDAAAQVLGAVEGDRLSVSAGSR